uniref:Fibrinogen C-terminal domain-containing protein n=1 Tax=Monopterus albus TaxID=43700 RepID=A0A3Q3IPJ1_MONAL|nr:SH3 domain-containing protein C23A1.17-like [Monopterus albus]
MGLTALCVFGTLLAFSSLFWTTADSGEGDLLGDKEYGPCVATLRPEGMCRQGEDEHMCPYLFSLPPLTVHLPKQLTELEKIRKDLHKLKDDVDQLRKMCADCTVSQSERECGRQSEREHGNLNEGMDRHKDERNWMNERAPETLKDFRQECETDKVTVEGDSDTDAEKRTIMDETERKEWESKRGSHIETITENEKEETLKELAEKDGKNKSEQAKGKDRWGWAKVPNAGGKKRLVGQKTVGKNNRETDTDRNKEKDRKGSSKRDQEDQLERGKGRKTTTNIENKKKTPESDHHLKRDKIKEENQTQTGEDIRDRDGIKMPEDREPNKEREQHREEKDTETGKGIKAKQNNDTQKQIGSSGHAEKDTSIKQEEVEEEEDRETDKEIKSDEEKTVQSVQRDSDGQLASSKAAERTDFVSFRPTPQSAIRSTLRHDSVDTSHLITNVNLGTMITAYGPPTQSTDLGAAGTSDAEADFRTVDSPTTTDTVSALGGSEHQITSTTARFTSTTSIRPGEGFQGRVSSTKTTATPSQNLYTTTFPEITDHSTGTAKKNISSNTTDGIISPPDLKPGEQHKQTLKHPKNDHKHDQVPLPGKKTKQDQNQRPSQEKPRTSQNSKPSSDNIQVQISKHDQRAPPDNVTADQNVKNNQTSKHNHVDAQNKLPLQKPNFQQTSKPPVQRATSHQTPVTNRQPEFVESPIINQNSKPDKEQHHTLETDKAEENQMPERKMKSEEKRKKQGPELSQHFTPVQVPKSERTETTSLMPKTDLEPVTELMENSDGSSSPEPKYDRDSTPGQKLTPDHANIYVKPGQNISKVKQKPTPGHTPDPNQEHPVLVTGQTTKPQINNNQTAQTNQGLKTPSSEQMSNLNPKSVPNETPGAESNKRATPRPPSSHKPLTRPIPKPGATPVQRPEPAEQPKPSPKTKTDLNLPHISVTTSDIIQNAQPTSDPAKQISELTHSPGETGISPSTMKTITPGPKIYNSPEPGPFPHLQTFLEAFTASPRSRTTSDLRPQTAGQLSPRPMTTRPNKIMRGIHPIVIPSTRPGSTNPNLASNTDSSLQAKVHHNMEEAAPRQSPDPDNIMFPAPSSGALTTSTVSPDIRATTTVESGPKFLDTESSTPSARELRVKINQVAVLFNNSLGPDGKALNRRLEKHQKEKQGGSRPDRTDSKLPTLLSSKVSRDCSDHLLRGETKSGVYMVTPDIRSKGFRVFCDMELGGGGWTLLQRRQDGSVSFNRSWAEYRSGFGNVDRGEFWLGNNMIHLLTRDRDMALRVELEDFKGLRAYAQYEQFRVASERLRYRLTVGSYSGTAGDALHFSKMYDHNNREFTTPDRDHDRYPSGNCGAYYSSGWWFDACLAANLNGRYYVEKYKGIRNGIFWGTWHNILTEYYPTTHRRSFKTVKMMIRPKGFVP